MVYSSLFVVKLTALLVPNVFWIESDRLTASRRQTQVQYSIRFHFRFLDQIGGRIRHPIGIISIPINLRNIGAVSIEES